ncbi:putative thymidine phosphorylase [Variovorax sp. CF313]|jgi:thymidine phosphorylase|uniref:thymidine phosphorylase family protein n=1 Tax=Variovorax sp. CF313 TaxID=1144315 RepID=UPI0002710956|nr:thymidine phosphorylase family protein [Variovorax sp. CF313]EJL80417.1 putative thymidine phosphorylase [Variovorax sp. CF313]
MSVNRLLARRAGIDTYQQPVVYMRSDCDVCRAEGFQSQAQVELISSSGHHLLAILHQVSSSWLRNDEIALSESAWNLMGAAEGDELVVRHPPVLDSLTHLRTKLHGGRLDYVALRALMNDVSRGRVPDIHLASFVTLCAGDGLDFDETVALTRAMVDVGERLDWGTSPVVDKHCIGGLPGNRTTLIVVPIVAACGVVMPKTSSRAITSAAGTADVMETLAPVDLDMAAMRRVVEQEGGCIAWGNAMRISPADDMLIRVERPLSIDSEGLMVASILSKKAAMGSQRVLIDIPVGALTKVRNPAAADRLSRSLVAVGAALGLQVQTVLTDGNQPVGRGVGPALEAMDVMAVLERTAGAPQDLRERALVLAGLSLEMADKAAPGMGRSLAREVLDDGRALAKFIAICEAQGGLRVPPKAAHMHRVCAPVDGVVSAIDTRLVARTAKLAGAPRDPAAGASVHVRVQDRVKRGDPLFTLHAESLGELQYALSFVRSQLPIVRIEAGVEAAGLAPP